MSKKKIIKPKSMEELQKTVAGLNAKGYTAVETPGMPKISGGKLSGKGRGVNPFETRGYNESASAVLDMSSSHIGGTRAKSGYNFFDAVQSKPKITPENVGTPKLGYIPWGPKDDVPNQVYTTMGQLTYTAAAMKYLVDLTVGLGPALVYEYTHYVNGTLVVKQIPYEHGGAFLKARIRELEEKKANAVVGVNYDEEIKSMKEDLARWTASWPEIQSFMERNNVELHYQKCQQDNFHLDIYFPTYGLSRGRAGRWSPKIVEIDMLPAVCTRMEQMDDNWRINHVYFSEKWRNDATKELEDKPMVAFPALDASHPLRDLRRIVEGHATAGIRKRPTWICAPSYYPSNQKPYYPQPACWSIYPSGAYAYAFSMLEDKAAARRNSTMFGKLIFINMEYVDRLCGQEGADDVEKQQEVKNQIIEMVDKFLKDRSNNGKAAFLDSFLSDDQKTLWEAIKIVDVPTGDTDKFDENDIETLANIIFLAFGVNPNLIGVSMSKSSNGGTFQRELHLLKQNQVSVHQRNYLRFLQDINRFNGWDPHAKWIIRQQVLTTLDRNANGLEAVASEQ